MNEVLSEIMKLMKFIEYLFYMQFSGFKECKFDIFPILRGFV